MKYKLKLDYTEEELRELKRLSKDYDSPMYAISELLIAGTRGVGSLQAKYMTMEHTKEFNFMADINNVIMGTAIFPEEKYVVHDSTTGQYIYYNATEWRLRWGQLEAVIPDEKTKDEWLAINSAYESMLEKVEN